MQTMVFTGRLAADPQISPDFAKAVFRLLEKRGVDAAGKDRLVGVNCVSWSKGLNEKVNRMHGIDDEAVREVWNEVERDVADRLAFLDILAGRLRAGGHRIQGNPPQFWSSPVLTSVLPHLAARQGQDAESLYRIPGIVSERSVRHDGFGVSPRLKRTASRVDRRGKGTPLAV